MMMDAPTSLTCIIVNTATNIKNNIAQTVINDYTKKYLKCKKRGYKCSEEY